MQVDSSLFRKLAHFYTERFTVFLPEFTQISNQTFTWINNGNITTKYCIYEFVTNLNFFLLSRIGN